MEDLQTYRARIGLFRHRLATKQNIPPHKRASCRQREQKRRQNRTRLIKSRRGSATKLSPLASSGKVVFGMTRGFAMIVIAILIMAGLTSGHMETGQFFAEKELPTHFPKPNVDGFLFPPALQQNYFIPSSTCDCLLGNAGVHAYNGNPRTPGNDDDTDMDRKVIENTPSGSRLEAGGDERSTLDQSQLAEQIQQLEIDIRKKHADMIRELHGYISPELPNAWNLFRNGLTPYLTRREIYGSCVTFVGDHCEILSSKGIIKLGDYNVLLDVVNPIDKRAGDVISTATTAIKDIKKRISDLKPQDRSDHTTSLEYKTEDLKTFEHTGESSKFLKPSTRLRERTIDVVKRENMIDQTEIRIRRERQHSTFITTNAFNVAIDILKNTNLLLIRGNWGDGKSVLAKEIIAWLMGDREEQFGDYHHDTVYQKKRPLFLKELKSWDETIYCNANLAIFIDDIFGDSSIYSEDLAWWKKISPFIRPVLDGKICHNANCMILTVRNDVYAEHRSLFCHEDVFTDNECVVDLSSCHGLTTDEKKNILRLYMPTGVELSKDDETAIVQSVLPFGFPECCRLFKSFANTHYQPREYFVKPLFYVKKIIGERLIESKQAALLYLLLATGKVPVSQLEPNRSNAQEDELLQLAFNTSLSGDTIPSFRVNARVQTKQNILKGLKSMIGSLVKLESNNFTFYHDVVEYAVAILYGQISPREFLRNVNIAHLRYIVTSQSIENALYIADEHIECLFNRILDELKSRATKQYEILTTLQVWDDEHFVRNFIAWVGQQESVPNDFYLEWTTEEYALEIKKDSPLPQNIDKSNCCSFFVFVAKSNKNTLLQQLIQQGKSNTTQMKLALDQACESGCVNCALTLLENKITPDSNTWISVVKGGSLDLLNKLISSDIYPLATTDDKTFGVMNINILQLACLYEKEQVILRLIQHFPTLLEHRDGDDNSVFHHIAMTNNCDLFEKIVTTVCFESQGETERKHYMETLLTSEGETVLHLASMSGKKAMCTHICQKYPSLISQRDNGSGHCLHAAAISGDVDCFMYIDDLVNQGKSETDRLHYMETLLTKNGKTVLYFAKINAQKTMCTHIFKTYPTLICNNECEH